MRPGPLVSFERMVHLRMVVPADRSDRVLELLEASRGVCNIVRLPAAARKPKGDVLLCDVAREAASLLISDLQDLGISDDGSIAIERVDTMLSRAMEEAERAAPGDPGNAVVWEQVEELTSESSVLNASFALFMVLATIIASVGIFLNTPILIIGAMVLGPEFGPIASFCVAVAERRLGFAWRSLLALAVGFPVGITAAFLAALLFKWTGLTDDNFTSENHSLASVISNPDFFSFLVAFCAGIAGILSLTTEKSGALTGVLVSVTTIPSAANIGVSAAYADWSAWRGSIEQLAINIGAIFLAGILTLMVQRRIYRRLRADHLRGRPEGALHRLRS
jgi:uncharacterized hydrophobic protein (TIGR00271 family)